MEEEVAYCYYCCCCDEEDIEWSPVEVVVKKRKRNWSFHMVFDS